MIAPSVLLARAVVHGWETEESMVSALIAAAIFAALGFVAGGIAELLVRDSVQGQFRAALAEFDEQQTEARRPRGNA